MKKASGIMREEYNELDNKYNECKKELECLQKKEENATAKFNAAKLKMKRRHDSIVQAL